MVYRRCVGCRTIKDRKDMIKVTVQNPDGEIIINGGTKIFGRSAYLCYNNSCIEYAFKKERLKKALKAPVPSELKGKILNEL